QGMLNVERKGFQDKQKLNEKKPAKT
ncbi:uncharacterized protein METZ01_LOCUS396408, partial [marine metagenome]